MFQETVSRTRDNAVLVQKEHAQTSDAKQFFQRKLKDYRADLRIHILYDTFVMIEFYDNNCINIIIRNYIELHRKRAARCNIIHIYLLVLKQLLPYQLVLSGN